MNRKSLIVTLALSLLSVGAFAAEYEKVNPTTAKRTVTVSHEDFVTLDRLSQQKADLEARLADVNEQITAVKGVGVKTLAEVVAEKEALALVEAEVAQ